MELIIKLLQLELVLTIGIINIKDTSIHIKISMFMTKIITVQQVIKQLSNLAIKFPTRKHIISNLQSSHFKEIIFIIIYRRRKNNIKKLSFNKNNISISQSISQKHCKQCKKKASSLNKSMNQKYELNLLMIQSYQQLYFIMTQVVHDQKQMNHTDQIYQEKGNGINADYQQKIQQEFSKGISDHLPEKLKIKESRKTHNDISIQVEPQYLLKKQAVKKSKLENINWDAVFVDKKFYLADPTKVNKLRNLDSQIQKGHKLIQKFQGKSLRKSIQSHKNKDQLSKFELNNQVKSKIIYQSKTQINENNNFNRKIQVQKELEKEEEKYRTRVQLFQNNTNYSKYQHPGNSIKSNQENYKSIIIEPSFQINQNQSALKSQRNQNQKQQNSNKKASKQKQPRKEHSNQSQKKYINKEIQSQHQKQKQLGQNQLEKVKINKKIYQGEKQSNTPRLGHEITQNYQQQLVQQNMIDQGNRYDKDPSFSKRENISVKAAASNWKQSYQSNGNQKKFIKKQPFKEWRKSHQLKKPTQIIQKQTLKNSVKSQANHDYVEIALLNKKLETLIQKVENIEANQKEKSKKLKNTPKNQTQPTKSFKTPKNSGNKIKQSKESNLVYNNTQKQIDQMKNNKIYQKSNLKFVGSVVQFHLPEEKSIKSKDQISEIEKNQLKSEISSLKKQIRELKLESILHQKSESKQDQYLKKISNKYPKKTNEIKPSKLQQSHDQKRKRNYQSLELKDHLIQSGKQAQNPEKEYCKSINYGKILKNKNILYHLPQEQNQLQIPSHSKFNNSFNHQPYNTILLDNEFDKIVHERNKDSFYQSPMPVPLKRNPEPIPPTIAVQKYPPKLKTEESSKQKSKEQKGKTNPSFKIKKSFVNKFQNNEAKWKNFMEREESNPHFTYQYQKDHDLEIKSLDPRSPLYNISSNNSSNPRTKYESSPSKKGIIIHQANSGFKSQRNQSDKKRQNKPQQQSTVYLSKHHQLHLENNSPKNSQNVVFELEFMKNQNQSLAKSQSQDDQESSLEIPKIQFSWVQIPQIPDPPKLNTTQEEIIEHLNKLSKVFDFQFDHKKAYMLVLKKYKNCIIFTLPETKQKIIWHYSGKIYIGDWEVSSENPEGQKTGKGTQYVPEKYYYKGQFLNGKKNGSGIQVQFNGNIYEGQWQNGEKSGKGKSFEKNPNVNYEGEWEHNKKQGYGIQKISEKQYYRGTFRKSIKNGYGRQKFSTADKYKGEYKNGKFHGEGKYTWSNGSSYSGNFIAGVRHGLGKWKSAKNNGDVYLGDYNQDKKNGYGRYIWNSGCIYEGFFKNDLKHGEGRVEYPDGRQMKGIWDEGQLSDIKSKLMESHAQEPLSAKQTVSGITTTVIKMVQTPNRSLRTSAKLSKI